MAHKHESHFIPSPYPTVTSYENEFVKEFNNNLSGAVAEVLKYIAKATASAIAGRGVFRFCTERK